MKFSQMLFALAGAAGLTLATQAAIPVTGAGAGPFDFATAPASPANFSTLSVAGGGADFEAVAAFDTAVINNTAATAVNTALGSSATTPPSMNAVARHNTTLLVLQSRPTGNAYTLMMATLVNNSGGDITSFKLTYDFIVANVATAAASEAIAGQRVYFSVTGAAGSWQLLPSLTGLTVNTPGASATISGIAWPAGANAYILWADDNSNVNEDWGNTIDNLAISDVSSMAVPTTIAITSPTNGQQTVHCADLVVATATTGSITNVAFLVNGVFFTNDTTFPFGGTIMVPLALPLGNYTLTAVATDTTGAMVTSAGVQISIIANQPPLIAITNTYSGAVTGLTFLVGSPVTVQASFSDDDAITNIEWQVDGTLYLSNRINNTWTYLNALAGTHTLRGIATDRKGQQRVSTDWTITVTNPPAPVYTLLITNGSDWKCFASASGAQPDEIIPGLFLQWYEFSYLETGWSSGLAELGDGDIPNGYPERTHIDIGPNNARYPSVYFRKKFNVANPNAFPNLVLRVLRDDGAIVWLNGVSVWTNNMATTDPDPVHPTAIANTNLAAASDDGVNYQVLNLLNLPSQPILSAGENIIAVQVHNQNATSSDLSFDLMLWGEASTVPMATITAPTNGQTFVQGVNVTVNATASTFVTNVIFKYNNVVFAQDSTPPYSVVLSNIGPVGPGAFDVMVQDLFGAMGSAATVNVTVVPNAAPSVTITNPPAGGSHLVGTFVAVGADASDTDGTVARVDFYDNGVLRLSDTTVPYGYTLSDLTAGQHSLVVVAVDNGGASTPSAPLILMVTNPPGLTAVLTNGASWKYLDNGTDQGTAWTAIGFDDSGWSNGIADFGYGDGPAVPERTVVGFGPDANAKYITTYFRKILTGVDPSAFAGIRVDALRDDGIVVHINGVEVFRDNFVNVATPILFNEQADAAIGGNAESTYISTNLPASVLAPGNNIIAVEIHQDDGASSDISFDLMIWGVTVGGPALSITTDGVNYTVSWNDPGGQYMLQRSSNLSSPANWADVPGNPASPYTQPLGASPLFFRLRKP